jgi:hypothetical protein
MNGRYKYRITARDDELMARFTTDELIEQSDNLSNELRRIKANLDHVMDSRDIIDGVIRRRLTNPSVDSSVSGRSGEPEGSLANGQDAPPEPDGSVGGRRSEREG